MIQVPYPVGERNFVVAPNELDLPASANLEHKNNHHLYWPYRQLGLLAITRTFRDLQHNQLEMPVDQHSALHQRYGPPKKLPGLASMMEQIEMAEIIGEPLVYQEDRRGDYITQYLTKSAIQLLKIEYDQEK